MTSPALPDHSGKPSLARIVLRQFRSLQKPFAGQEGWRTWLFEIFIFTAVIVALAAILQPRIMLMSASPHPLWLPVIAASLVHGTLPGLAAAIIAGLAAWLFGPPVLTTEDDYYDLMFRLFKEPVLWLFAALLLGTYRDRIEDERQKLGDERDQARDDLARVVDHATALRRRVDELERAVVLADLSSPSPVEAARSLAPVPTDHGTEHDRQPISPVAPQVPAHSPEVDLDLPDQEHAPISTGLVPPPTKASPRLQWSWACLWGATPVGWECLGSEGGEHLPDPGRLLRHFDQQLRVYDSRSLDDRRVMPPGALVAIPLPPGPFLLSRVLIVGGGHIDQDLNLNEVRDTLLFLAGRLADQQPAGSLA